MAVIIDGTTGVATPGVTDTGDLSVAGTTTLTTPLPVTSGGTGATSLSGVAVGNLAGGSAGTIPYQSTVGTTAMLATGTSGQVLTSAGALAAPIWSTLNSVTPSVIATSTAAVAGTYYVITASLTLTLPASPSDGQFIGFSNLSGTTTPVIGRNGNNIMALAEDLTLDSAQARGTLVYTGATNGWVLFDN